MEKHSVAKLVGALRAMLHDAGQLTEKVRRNPYPRVIGWREKAHPDVMYMFCKFDDGLFDRWSRPYRQLQRHHYHHDSTLELAKLRPMLARSCSRYRTVTLYLENSVTSSPEFMNRLMASLNSNPIKENLLQIVTSCWMKSINVSHKWFIWWQRRSKKIGRSGIRFKINCLSKII